MTDQAREIILLDAVTGTGAGEWKRFSPNFSNANATFHSTEYGTSGAFTGTVDIEVSNDGVNPLNTPMGTLSMSGTGATVNSDGFASNASWAYIRGKVTAISGTGANISVKMGA